MESKIYSLKSISMSKNPPKKTYLELEAENSALRDQCKTLQHWARRYCDERRTYVTSWFNEITRYLLKLGIALETCDGIIWARDGAVGIMTIYQKLKLQKIHQRR